MGSEWQIVAFPVILPWRQEFWTLPLYFPDLKVGVVPQWPPQLPYQGIPLPPEAEAHSRDLQHYHPGDLRQWHAFDTYLRPPGEEADLPRAIRAYGHPPLPETPEPQASPDAWSLAWQLEKMQADQDAQLTLVDQGHDWLREILAPESWEDRTSIGPVPGVGEMVDPDLARLRHALWRRVMAPYLQDRWAPFLLGRSSRPLFLTLRGWPRWTEQKQVQVPLPGCRSAAEWSAVAGENGAPRWRGEFTKLLGAALSGAAQLPNLEAAARNLREWVEDEVAAHWPLPEMWRWDLEVWVPEGPPEETIPVLCWGGADAGILPG